MFVFVEWDIRAFVAAQREKDKQVRICDDCFTWRSYSSQYMNVM